MGDIAEAAAIALAAEKLIYVVEQEGILNEHGTLISNLSAQEARELLDNQRAQPNQRRLLQSAVNAVEKQVQRTQILSGRQDGSLIRELFTRHGAGTSVARAAFMTIRQAQSSDISAITTLIRPLEDEGVLLRRSREYLENHIGEFSILEHDRQIYGCVALKTFEPSEAGELACLVVSPEAQDGGYGELLLEHLLANARARGIRRLFALSTHTGEWFIERGFQAAAVADLPEERQQEYHQSRRQSKVFVYSL
jgi:amino-acid N-acetyltransferase